MKIAITIWGNRISPVFDSAKTLMIVQVKNLKVIAREFEKFNPKIPTQIASHLQNSQVDVLVCGAITEPQTRIIERSGITLISFVSGNTDKVIASLLKKPCGISDFLMPGGIGISIPNTGHLM